MAWLVLIIGGLLIGLTLGLMGSGGSILTVPVLVYLVGHQDKIAIAESMAIVGLISLLTVIPYARGHEVHWRSVVYFGIPGTAGTYLGAYLSKFLPGSVQLIVFSVILFVAAGLMLKGKRTKATASPSTDDNDATDTSELPVKAQHHPIWQIMLEGTLVGVITGIVGVGGGFLIVPALVLLGGLSMRLAVGTSLAIITMKSAAGFYKHIAVLTHSLAETQQSLDWQVMLFTVLVFTAFGVMGSFTGRIVSKWIDQQKLRTGFGIFLVIMGILILSVESYKLWDKNSPTPPEPTAAIPPAQTLTDHERPETG